MHLGAHLGLLVLQGGGSGGGGGSGHVFDTGAPAPQRTLIQQGAVTLLSGLKRPAGYLVDVIAFGSPIRDWRDEQGVTQLIDAFAGRMPSIAVALGDGFSDQAGIGGFQANKEIEVILYIASDNPRDQQIGRLEIDVTGQADVHADPGLHVIMEHAVELMIGQRAGASTSIKAIRPVSEVFLADSPPVLIWMQTYQVSVKTTISSNRTVTQLLTSIRTRTTTSETEPPLPAAATDPATIDANTDDL